MKKQSVKSIIMSSKPGQLGNMLFLFAHFIAFAAEKNVSIKAPAFEEYARYFDSTCGALIPSYPISHSTIKNPARAGLRRLFYRISFFLAKIIIKLRLNNSLVSAINIDWNESFNLENESKLKLFNSRYIFIQGWLYRSDSLIQKHKNTIVDFFKPTDVHINSVNKLIPAKREVLVGVHIRQGDYKVFEGGKYFFEISQYLSFMKNMLAVLSGKKALFLICSNSVLKFEDFSGVPFIFGSGKEIEDLYAFSKCDFLIGPPSTFSMWASFYGNVPLYQVHDSELDFTLEDFKVVKD